jgi:ABC-type dipeptide/oligopeptide/nickel transport system permease subunit
MISNARSWISESVWMTIFPGLAIVITVLGFNFLGDGLRDVLDPRVATDLGDVVAARSSAPQNAP